MNEVFWLGVDGAILQVGSPAVMGPMSNPPQTTHSTLVAAGLHPKLHYLKRRVAIGAFQQRMVRYHRDQP
ncbi:MAG: hypothetical protein CYG59_10190 [Chloroflexi bacterium]|nr:MAG: hypothetical protein CYG59_10190 [Chloroflexota bacterium]